jgi:GDP-mannose 6-dehydrogenase
MNICVFGLGYVGSVSAACLAARGHRVVGVDPNTVKVDAINEGRSPIVERGLEELIREGRRAGTLRATTDPAEAAGEADVLMICVGTPSDTTGIHDFTFLDRVCADIGAVLCETRDFKVVVVRSTLLPGTVERRIVPLLTRLSGKQRGRDFGLATNPEFLREGSAVDDFNHPPFTIVGSRDARSSEIVAGLYEGVPAPIFHTDPDSASMVKYASNAFHGLKVAFANEIGLLCKQAGLDGTQVMDIFCQDRSLNISSRYLKPGFAFGGSCLPKDLRALLHAARHADLQLPVLEAILPSNRLHIQRVVELVLSRPGRARVGVLGLTFKPGTDDLRESPMVQLVETLSGKGLPVRIWDPNVALSKLMGGNKAFIEQVLPHISAMMSDSMEDVAENSDVLVVSHAMPDGGAKLTSLLRPDQMLIDLVKLPAGTGSDGVAYQGVCW